MYVLILPVTLNKPLHSVLFCGQSLYWLGLGDSHKCRLSTFCAGNVDVPKMRPFEESGGIKSINFIVNKCRGQLAPCQNPSGIQIFRTRHNMDITSPQHIFTSSLSTCSGGVVEPDRDSVSESDI